VKAAPAPAPVSSPFDMAVGAAVMSDYNFRGVSQSNRGPSAGAYFEPQFNTGFGTLYVGLAGWAIDWPGEASYGFTDPSAEIDLYGGWRKAWGPLSIDLGAIYYYYPKETFNGFTTDSDFYEIYAKAGYEVASGLTVGANVFYTPDLLNYSESFAAGDVDAVYGSATGKWVLPWTTGPVGAYISGELGHWWIDDGNWSAAGLGDPSYTYWNAGIAFTYKAITLDLRYHGTDQSVQDCANFLLVSVGNASNDWCNDTFIATLKFDTSLSALQ
jgi:uncharacterized protein (TIGR02001 family)